MRLQIVWLPAALAVMAALPTRAFAQTERAMMDRSYTERRGTDSVEITFFVDNLLAGSSAALGVVSRPVPGAARAGLVRPRLTFVPELVKSADAL